MKMKPEHFDALKEAVTETLAKHPGIADRYAAAGLSSERMRWDALNASGFDTRPLYTYLCDSHIDTALRSIVV